MFALTAHRKTKVSQSIIKKNLILSFERTENYIKLYSKETEDDGKFYPGKYITVSAVFFYCLFNILSIFVKNGLTKKQNF